MDRIWCRTATAKPFVALTVALIIAACSSSASPNQSSPSTQSPPATALATAEVPSVAPSGATGTPSSAPPAAADVTGTWSGTWKRDPPLGGGGTMTLHLQQSGSKVTGDITAQGSLCLTKPGIPLTGTFSDPALEFGVTGDNLEIDYTATLSGTALTGKLNAVKCPAGVATGSFELKKS
jgi:hypothetical protein